MVLAIRMASSAGSFAAADGNALLAAAAGNALLAAFLEEYNFLAKFLRKLPMEAIVLFKLASEGATGGKRACRALKSFAAKPSRANFAKFITAAFLPGFAARNSAYCVG